MEYRVGDGCFSESHGSSMKMNPPRFRSGRIHYNMCNFAALCSTLSGYDAGGTWLESGGGV